MEESHRSSLRTYLLLVYVAFVTMSLSQVFRNALLESAFTTAECFMLIAVLIAATITLEASRKVPGIALLPALFAMLFFFMVLLDGGRLARCKMAMILSFQPLSSSSKLSFKLFKAVPSC